MVNTRTREMVNGLCIAGRAVAKIQTHRFVMSEMDAGAPSASWQGRIATGCPRNGVESLIRHPWKLIMPRDLTIRTGEYRQGHLDTWELLGWGATRLEAANRHRHLQCLMGPLLSYQACRRGRKASCTSRDILEATPLRTSALSERWKRSAVGLPLVWGWRGRLKTDADAELDGHRQPGQFCRVGAAIPSWRSRC